MTEIYTTEGGQKDVLVRRANIKKNEMSYIFTAYQIMPVF